MGIMRVNEVVRVEPPDVKEKTTQDLCLPCEDTGRKWPWQARSQLDHGLSSLQN